MNTFPAASAVVVDFTFARPDGSAYDVASAEWRVLDELGAVVRPAESVAIADGATSLSLATAIGDNDIGTEPRGMRTVELTLTTAAGEVVRLKERYLLEGETVLAIGQNTFQTYGEALITAASVPRIDAWEAAGDAARHAALETAFHRLAGLRFRVSRYDQDYLNWGAHQGHLVGIEEADFRAFPEAFLTAIRRAQVIEADVILGGDQVGEMRRDGVQSTSVGEVSQFFRKGKPLMQRASNRAMRELSGYVKQSVRIGRA